MDRDHIQAIANAHFSARASVAEPVRNLTIRQKRALERAYDATAPDIAETWDKPEADGSFCTTWATRNTVLTTPQMYAALRQLEARGLVERAGQTLADWKLTPKGMVTVGAMGAA